MHGDCLTVTGQTMAENLAHIAPPDPDGKVLRALNNPIHPTGGITILHGSLAPEGAVVKSAGFDSDVFEGTARVFERERAALDALEDGTITARRRRRDPLRGPQGRPGHARDARHHRRDQGRRARQGRAADDRRPVLRRHHRPVRRARRTRGGRRRPDRVPARRRPHPARRRQGHARRAGRRRPNSSRARRVSSRCRRSTPPACWPSTRSWSARRPAARSAASGPSRRSAAGRSRTPADTPAPTTARPCSPGNRSRPARPRVRWQALRRPTTPTFVPVRIR